MRNGCSVARWKSMKDIKRKNAEDKRKMDEDKRLANIRRDRILIGHYYQEIKRNFGKKRKE